MIIVTIFFVYFAIVIAVMMFFVWTRTGVFWYFIKASASKDVTNVREMIDRFESLNEEIRPPSYATVRLQNESFIVSIEGYPEIVFDNVTEIAAKVAGLRGTASSQKISYYGLETARMFLQVDKSENRQFAHKIALEILRHWFSKRIKFCIDPYAWYETVVSARRLNCIVCLAYLSETESDTNELSSLLLNEIRACEKHIAKSYTYDWSTNHGLMDDYNVLLGDYILDSGFKRRASGESVRSIGRVDYFVSGDGVVLEPATSYWFMIKKFLNRIVALHEMMEIQVEKSATKKLESLDHWLAFASVNGLYARIGDTSGANSFTPPQQYEYEKDGMFLHCTDTGLCYLNSVNSLNVQNQLFLNAQYCPPLTHAHEDALAINLISDGTVWINSPGYFSPSMKDFGVNIRSVENQSTAWCPSVGYRKECEIEHVKASEEKACIRASIALSSSSKLTREIVFDSKSGYASITDETSNGDVLISSFIFDSTVQAELADGTCLLRDQHQKSAELSYIADKADLQESSISYQRNQLKKTTKLVLSGTRNYLRLKLAKPGQSVVLISSDSYPYKLRRELAAPFAERCRKILVRFTFRRIKQLILVLTVLATASLIAAAFQT